ncbi:TPA: PT domain-containing protein [Streptococcus pyogenes]|uniref:PT domain-containing protein n=1 Tax=Streptococcus pyogenes TaxID=1314 RepID=UPI000DF9D732|nr:PT domain-containing protein [Streptococcus pyogenes]UEN90056.1 conjugal transfer protein [Streptococcus pyogenes]WSE67934.1 PT domain-containing protein [Streptococcus pyogenes]SUO76074.1 membrane protein [Streptococcus pyogenes]VGT77104.1 membrane protein [Streptococcus pyogenes]HEP1375812.1 conjugal transfer protein [Streptococcus pyogenes]
MQEAFEKLKGVDIFALKSYLEKTSIIETSIIVAMNEIFVNLFFFLLNLVVGFFSLMIRIMENIDLYDSYKTYVYNAAKSIWQGLTGSISGGLSSGSLVSMLLTIGAFYLFYQYFFSRGNFMRKVLHVLLVVLLGFGYFGTVASTSGGLYILDTVDNLADTVTSKISNISVSYGEDKSIKVGKSMADSYIAQTSYTAYVFVNTGQENGKYVNSQTGEEEAFDDSKVLGSVDDSGKFVAVKNKDRKDYLDKLGDKADDGKEKNRWVSAVWDYLFIKTFYVIFKIIEAIVIEVPIILVQLLNLIAQLLVLVMIFLFPIALLISFFPAMQDIIFGIFKVMFGGLVFPTITTLITLIIFYIEKVIETLITSGFDGVIESFPSLGTFALLFKLILSVVAKAAVYYFLWIYKGELIEFIMGSRARIKMEDIGNQVEDKVSQGKDLIQQMPSRNFEAAQHLGNFAMAGNGFVAGSAMNASSHIKEVGNFFRRSKPSEPAVEPNVPTDQPTEQPGPTPDQLPPTSSEPHIPKQDIPTDNPTQEKTPTPEATPSQPTTPPSPEMEFQELKEQWVSPRKQRKMERLEREFSAYDDAGAMYQAQGSNAFTRSFSQTMTRDDKIKANIERKNRLTQELNRLRGEQNEHY